MRFRDLAWGTLVYHNANKGSKGEEKYDGLVGDKRFLKRLQNKPIPTDFGLMQDFLVHFGVRFAPPTLQKQLVSAWPHLKPYIRRLRNENLADCDFSNDKIREAILKSYGYLLDHTWGGDTATGKMIHFFNVRLFVMWDKDMRSAYGKPFRDPGGYLEFLEQMQKQARQAITDFKRLSLVGSPESWISQELGHPIGRPLTKYIDEYNWMTITRKWPTSPPTWLLSLYKKK